VWCRGRVVGERRRSGYGYCRVVSSGVEEAVSVETFSERHQIDIDIQRCAKPPDSAVLNAIWQNGANPSHL
jgi:hypothetical protein